LLVLFDIDGTLVRSRPLTHQRALARAAVEVFGLHPETDERAIRAVEPWGKTDRQILRDLLAGRTPSAAEIAVWERTACNVYSQIEDGTPDDGDRRTAGVLERLRSAGHDLALVTGNLEPIARRKLDGRGLGRYFPAGQGGFGSDADTRVELVALARRRAGDRRREETVLIGDTPRDVEAAIADGVRSIAVTGGRYGRVELLAAGAASVIDELGELDAVL
jgi:phosphoglycolate phosphatase-like HAD superfamily hydrolase